MNKKMTKYILDKYNDAHNVNGTPINSKKKNLILFPLYRRTNYVELAKNFISVEKMNIPAGLLYYFDKK